MGALRHSEVIGALLAAVSLCVTTAPASAGAAGAAASSEGVFDTTFAGGHVNASFGTLYAAARGVVVQPDGKTVIAGDIDQKSFAVLRYRKNGTLDPTFSGDGIAKVSMPDGGSGEDVALQTDGKIVVVGPRFNTGDSTNDFAIVRLLPNGTRDDSFGVHGLATYGLTANGDNASAVAIQPDGKIVVAGSAYNGADNDVAVVRFTKTGAPDPSFGGANNGIRTSELTGVEDNATDVAVAGGGNIVVSGSYDTGTSQQSAVWSFTSDGLPDTSFDGDGAGPDPAGVAFTDLGPSYETAASVLVLPNGKIVMAGGHDTGGGGGELHLVRYLVTGGLDDTFGTGGIVTGVPVPGTSAAMAVTRQRDGKLVVSGAVGGADVALAVFRFTADGQPDPTFGEGSTVELAQTSANLYAVDVAVGRDGRISTAGYKSFGSSTMLTTRIIGDATPPSKVALAAVPRWILSRHILTWTATDDNTGVASYDLQRRQAGYASAHYRAWSTWRAKTSARHAGVRGKPGHTYCFRVRARDRAGNTGSYSRVRCVAVPLDERALTPTGSWRSQSGPAFYRGTALASTHAGSALTVRASYRHLGVVATTCPACGRLRVYVGKHLLATVNLASTKTRHRQLIDVASAAKPRTGLIRLVQHSAGKKVIVEGLAVSLA